MQINNKNYINLYYLIKKNHINIERMINMEENLNVLDELNKGATLGIDAI